MKLNELYETQGLYRTSEEYSRLLRSKGYTIPKIRNRKGFILVTYSPKKSEKVFKTFGEAENAAPSDRDVHWQIFDGKTGVIRKEPDWVVADELVSQSRRGNY